MSALDDFLELQDRDPNAWWHLGSGEHLNLFEEAVDRMEDAEEELDNLRDFAEAARTGWNRSWWPFRGWK